MFDAQIQVAVVPMGNSVQICVAEPGSAGNAPIEQYPLSIIGIEAIGERLQSFERPHIAIKLGKRREPWRRPDGSIFHYVCFPPGYKDWQRYLAAWGEDGVGPDDIRSGIYLKLRSSAWMFPILERTFAILPLQDHKKRDARWLVDLLRRGQLRSAYGREELHDLAELITHGDLWAIEEAVAFIEDDTASYWHGRGRALLARRLKHCQLAPEHRQRFLSAILGRFEQGNLFAHFKVALRTALLLDPAATEAAAQRALDCQDEQTKRYAGWLIERVAEARRATVLR